MGADQAIGGGETPARQGLCIPTLMALVAVVALVTTWYARNVHDAKIQRQAIEAIQADGGWVWYDWEWRDGQPTNVVKPPWPRWLVRRYGIDFFANVVEVHFGRPVSDVQLGQLSGLRRLEQLYLGGSSVTDRGLVQLEGLSHLKSLNLASTAIRDSGVAHLRRLVGLRSLNLYNTKISDEALATIAGLTNLEELHLDNTDVSDAGLALLRPLTRLRILNLIHTDISDRGLVHLRGMKRLELVNAALSHVTAFGAQELHRELPRVRVVSTTMLYR